MTVIASPPVTMTAGVPVEVSYPTNAPIAAMVLSNLSPFLLELIVTGQAQWIGPWSEQLFQLPPGHQQITVMPNAVPFAGGSAGPSQFQVTWYGPGETPAGTWPVSLTAQAIAAAITGTVTAAQGQIQLNIGQTLTFGGTGSVILNLLGSSIAHVNAIGVGFANLPGTGNWQGLQVTVSGTLTGNIYYQGRPLANAGLTSWAPLLIVPFPADLEGQGLTVTVSSTGASGGVQFSVCGFLGAVPPVLPAPIVARTANTSATINASSSPASATILPALTDGRQYRIWEASLALGSGSGGGTLTNGVVGFISGSTAFLYTTAPGGATNTAPGISAAPTTDPADGMIQGSGSIGVQINPPPGGTGTGTAYATVTYDYV